VILGCNPSICIKIKKKPLSYAAFHGSI